MLALKDPSLLKSQCLVDGNWIDAADGKTIDVTNPADGSVIGTVPSLSVDTIKEAINASNKALPAWAAKTAKERAGILRKWFDLIVANADDIALIMTSEQGKPLAEARGEVLYAASFIEWFAEEAKRVYGDTIPATQPGQRLTVIRQPVGVDRCNHAMELPGGNDYAKGSARTGCWLHDDRPSCRSHAAYRACAWCSG